MSDFSYVLEVSNLNHLTVTRICNLNDSWTSHHSSFKLSSKQKHLNLDQLIQLLANDCGYFELLIVEKSQSLSFLLFHTFSQRKMVSNSRGWLMHFNQSSYHTHFSPQNAIQKFFPAKSLIFFFFQRLRFSVNASRKKQFHC